MPFNNNSPLMAVATAGGELHGHVLQSCVSEEETSDASAISFPWRLFPELELLSRKHSSKKLIQSRDWGGLIVTTPIVTKL